MVLCNQQVVRWTRCLIVVVISSSLLNPIFASSSFVSKKKVVIGVDGGTESIRACCFDAISGRVVGTSHAVPYSTIHPKPGWAEQDPEDWYENLGQAVREALASIPKEEMETLEICGLCLDTTCCSVVALDKDCSPLRRSILWMDARSADQTKEILEKCKGDPALLVNCGGDGPLSAEWMTPKALWIQQNEPEVWEKAHTICEYQDYLNFKLTGVICASSCNAASRWHWNGEECIKKASKDNLHPGRPVSMYSTLGIPELADKLPQKCLPMGALVGGLTAEAAAHLHLPEGLPVAQGGPDAFVGMIGLGCIYPGQLCLITGSSHLHCVVTSMPTTFPGTWGAYQGAPLPGLNFAEGGQSSTGSILRWARTLFGASEIDYSMLDTEAAEVNPGCDGLIALETFQGSRTPITDPLARGALIGLTLSHTRAHVWRALMEAVCYGTRACIEGLSNAGHRCDEIIIAGGATRSPFWLQMHADVTGKPVVVCENADAPLLGCAILASVAVGVHATVSDAVQSMVRTSKRIEPTDYLKESYSKFYDNVYAELRTAARAVTHSMAALQREKSRKESPLLETVMVLEGGATTTTQNGLEDSSDNEPTISPSLLACDWSNIAREVDQCLNAGTNRLHVDIFDGVFLDSPYALTFGPQMVQAIRRCSEQAILDLHMCVERPSRYVPVMAEAGANTFIFQWEAMADDEAGQLAAAIRLAKFIVEHGMDCGVSINPATSEEEIFPLLETGLISVVDVLAVEPGFGGQAFQPGALQKIDRLRRFRIESFQRFKIMVDVTTQ